VRENKRVFNGGGVFPADKLYALCAQGFFIVILIA
jgi:hypothetical protein